MNSFQNKWGIITLKMQKGMSHTQRNRDDGGGGGGDICDIDTHTNSMNK